MVAIGEQAELVAIGEQACETEAHVEVATHAAVKAATQLEAPAAVLAADVTPVHTPPIVDCAPAGEDKTMANKKRCPEDLGEALELCCIFVLSSPW